MVPQVAEGKSLISRIHEAEMAFLDVWPDFSSYIARHNQCVYQWFPIHITRILPVAVIYYLGAGLCGVVGMLFIARVQLSGRTLQCGGGLKCMQLWYTS